MSAEKLQYLYQKCLDAQATEEERAELRTLLQHPAYEQQVLELLGATLRDSEKPPVIVPEDLRQEVLNNIFLAGQSLPSRKTDIPLRRMPFLRKWQWAAVVMLFGASSYFWATSKRTIKTQASSPAPLTADIQPGGNSAVLTLGDGSTITLDSASNGQLVQQGNAQIVKRTNGQIIYTETGRAQGATILNTMSTPRGGQYQLTLPEGTKVWLNAASSITYPVTFNRKERAVKITGEVYFEVTKNEEQPFIVDVNGQSNVIVLGTSFNVNSYADEGVLQTTLLEGSVKVAAGTGQQAVILLPGQQAQIIANSQSNIQVIKTVDLNQVMAWKNGFFNLQDATLENVMKQLERWYNVDVKYEGKIPAVTFEGRLDKRVNLSDVLQYFSDLGINIKREGRTLIVTGN
ncbi:FecR domain-containing protein [Chitinophaga sp. 30R24]|uniref:FecR domain-containing protein n=1 Tax=Chitinophaga sp. 30R24 TaxID=3248838 RepID=UPI003B91C609